MNIVYRCFIVLKRAEKTDIQIDGAFQTMEKQTRTVFEVLKFTTAGGRVELVENLPRTEAISRMLNIARVSDLEEKINLDLHFEDSNGNIRDLSDTAMDVRVFRVLSNHIVEGRYGRLLHGQILMTHVRKVLPPSGEALCDNQNGIKVVCEFDT